MTSDPNRGAEDAITARGGALRRLFISATGIILLPTLLLIVWIALIREPAFQERGKLELARALAENQAWVIGEYAADVMTRTEKLAGRLPPDTPPGPIDPVEHGFADAESITVVPLDDLGTANLEPGQFNITSHIGVDLARRAFAGHKPPPEFVVNSQSALGLFVRPYGNPTAGVVIVRMTDARFQALVQPGGGGRFRLIQQLPEGPVNTIAGNLGGRDILASVAVPGTEWRVQAAPTASWAARLIPSWVPMAVGAALGLLGVLAGVILLRIQLSRLLRADVARIMAAAETRDPAQIQLASLLPLARLTRQLTLLTRRQMAARARWEAAQPDAAGSASDPAVDTGSPPVAKPAPPAKKEDVPAPEEPAKQPAPASEKEGESPIAFREACICSRPGRSLSAGEVEKIGRAIAVVAENRNLQGFVVGHDAGPKSAEAHTALTKALLAGGCDVVDIGEAPAPLFHYATHETEAESGIFISSDATDGCTSLQLVFNRLLVEGDDIQEIGEALRGGVQTFGKGRAIKADLTSDYIDRIALDIALALPLKIVIDNDFGSAASIAPALFRELDCDVVSINEPGSGVRPDGRSLDGALSSLADKVRETHADLGVLFDHGANRIHTVTEAGTAVATDKLLMLLAGDILERNPGSDVVFDPMCGRHLAPFVTRAGGRPVIARSGQASVHQKLVLSNAPLGGNFTGHVFLSERWFNFNDAFYVAARLLEILSAASSGFDAMVTELPTLKGSPEFRLVLGDEQCDHVMRELLSETDFQGARITTFDGLRVDYADGWGLVRKASTQPALSLRFEGKDDSSLERVKSVLHRAIKKASPDLELPF